jgi:hypothetical protein
MEEYADTSALDAGLLAAAQAVEHYEISRYGTLKTWAERTANDNAVGFGFEFGASCSWLEPTAKGDTERSP